MPKARTTHIQKSGMKKFSVSKNYVKKLQNGFKTKTILFVNLAINK